MKRSIWLILLIIAMLALAGCQSVEVVADEADEDEAMGLAGTSWLMSSLGGDLPVNDTSVTLEFGDDGSVTGSDGCNRFNTTYVQTDNMITIAEPAASTMIACSALIMNQADDFMDALTSASSFKASGNQLILLDGSEILATFVAVSQDLADTMWEVTAFNNGREAVVGLLEGTEITAEFGVDGMVSGSAGCNNYFAGFTVDNDNNITIEMPASSMRFCEEPPGVMEQEMEFLAALESVATYSVEGNTLQMRTADDQLALWMERIYDVDIPEPDQTLPWGRVVAPLGMNIRSGPGVNFPIIGHAAYNDEGEIVGRNAEGTWWAVNAPTLPEGIGWVSADFVIAVGAEDVPVIDVVLPPAPAPTVVPPATPTPVPAATATPTAQISFSVDRATIDQGQCATLQWNAQNVQAVWVYPRGSSFDRFPRATQGSELVCPPVTTTYEMRVLRRDGGTEFREVTVTVRPTAQPQISFWADSTNIRQGQCTRLHWNVQNVQGVWVYPQGADFNRYPRVGQDSETVCPNSTTTYEMRVQLQDGSTVFREITINVAAATATPVPPTPTPVPPAPPTATPAPPEATNPLAGTNWNVIQFNNGSAIVSVIEGSRINVSFGANGQISGNSGCNTFNGSYTVNGSNITISGIGGGMMACDSPEGVMQQESEFLAALQTARTFSINGNQLELQNGGGNIAVIANRGQ